MASAAQEHRSSPTSRVTDDNCPWWEGIDGPVPEHLIDWRGRAWRKGSSEKAAHPNSRFTAPARAVPVDLAASWDDPQGVPISAIVFGGRRARTAPLVLRGVRLEPRRLRRRHDGLGDDRGATGAVGVVRRDPMAMLPFCGYNMGDYFGHWLHMGAQLKNPPKIFHVNWFRQDEHGKFLWPGFGENLRVLRWMLDRCNGAGNGNAVESPIGMLPTQERHRHHRSRPRRRRARRAARRSPRTTGARKPTIWASSSPSSATTCRPR